MRSGFFGFSSAGQIRGNNQISTDEHTFRQKITYSWIQINQSEIHLLTNTFRMKLNHTCITMILYDVTERVYA